jgi:dihydropteroate synthase
LSEPLALVEPLGLIDGPAAAEAVAAGRALPLAGGPLAFALVRLIDDGRIVLVDRVPAAYGEALARVSAAPPAWAGLAARPLVMGIVNVTADSFSDGGDHLDAGRAIEAGLAMRVAGADVVDVGGESTRPGALPVSPKEEQARVVAVIRALAGEGVVVSIDSRNAATMRAALDAGARIVNDVSALTHDAAAAGLVAERGCPVVLMHMRHDPASMTALARYDDVAVEVTRELAGRVAAAEAAGIERARIAVDPGIGFAKNHAHNIALLPRLALLANLGCPIVVGVSRKRFIGRLAGVAEPRRRLPGSLAAGLLALSHGAAMLRVHDVGQTVQAMRVWRGLTDTGEIR